MTKLEELKKRRETMASLENLVIGIKLSMQHREDWENAVKNATDTIKRLEKEISDLIMKNYYVEGVCPHCGKRNLSYSFVVFKNLCGYSHDGYFPCRCLSCGWRGKELHELVFVKFIDNERSGIYER